jgi:hypothetical protein
MSHSANQFPLFPNETGGTLPASTDLHCENGHGSPYLATLTQQCALMTLSDSIFETHM